MIEAVRPATTADRDVLLDLVAADAAELAGQRGGPLHVAGRGRVDPLGDGAWWVATIDDVVVGYADAEVAAVGELAVARIRGLFIEAGAREVGLGEQLVEAVLAWAAAQGCMGVDAVVLPGQRQAKNLFERLGMTARAITVHRAV